MSGLAIGKDLGVSPALEVMQAEINISALERSHSLDLPSSNQTESFPRGWAELVPEPHPERYSKNS
jgi:hypothetical protein